jgi:methylase of polypeptide subunit release factors
VITHILKCRRESILLVLPIIQEHNDNPNYWDILLSDLKDKELWDGKIALDFASGKGRNVTNLLSLCDWERVDGIDISSANIDFCKRTYETQNSDWYCNNGTDVSDLKDNRI